MTDCLVTRLRHIIGPQVDREVTPFVAVEYSTIKKAADRIEELEKSLSKMQEDVDFLNRLRAHGVDNWDGYELALGEDDDD